MIVGDTLCVHGGLAMPHLDFVGGFNALNQEAEEWVNTGGDGSGRAPPLLEHPNGPLWMRIFSNPSDVPIPYTTPGAVGGGSCDLKFPRFESHSARTLAGFFC